MAHISLIVKVTRLCNLRCTYCHDWRTGVDQVMSFPVLARVIAKALGDATNHHVQFIWHGGETTLLPISYYEKALLVQAYCRRKGQVVQNIIQTNGTRITPEWVKFLQQNQFSVGISLDGPPPLHDSLRYYASGKPSSTDVLNGIGLLRDAGVRFSVLMVIDEVALGLGADRIFDFLLDYRIRNVALIAATPLNQRDGQPTTQVPHYVDPARMNEFLGRMFDRWAEHADQGIRIRELDAIRQALSSKEAAMCTLAGSCLGLYYGVEPNGDISHCDVFVGDSDYTLGNIFEDDFAGLRDSQNMLRLRRNNEDALQLM